MFHILKTEELNAQMTIL